MSTGLEKGLKTPRPRRGSPEQTRDRLVAAAATVFNRVGYHGTDSNRIAEEAGYSTGTFYKHFKDKREIFLAAYETWVSAEWERVRKELSAGGGPPLIAGRLVEMYIDFHVRWRGLRSSLLELVFSDAEVRRFYRKQRRRQLDLMAQLRLERGIKARRREEDAMLLFTLERAGDALAQGELGSLGLDRSVFVELLSQSVAELLGVSQCE